MKDSRNRSRACSRTGFNLRNWSPAEDFEEAAPRAGRHDLQKAGKPLQEAERNETIKGMVVILTFYQGSVAQHHYGVKHSHRRKWQREPDGVRSSIQARAKQGGFCFMAVMSDDIKPFCGVIIAVFNREQFLKR